MINIAFACEFLIFKSRQMGRKSEKLKDHLMAARAESHAKIIFQNILQPELHLYLHKSSLSQKQVT